MGITFVRETDVPLKTSAHLQTSDHNLVPTDLWTELTAHPTHEFALDILRAVRTILDGCQTHEVADALPDDAADALGGTFPTLARWLAESSNDRRFWRALGQLRDIGHGRPTGIQSTLEDIPAVLSVLNAADITPTIVVELPHRERFTSTARTQREGFCRVLTALANSCDLRLVCSRGTMQYLADTHREDLPGVRDAAKAHTRSRGPVEQDIRDARAALRPESSAVTLLRLIAESETDARSYGELYSVAPWGTSRVRQLLTRLAEFNLIGRFDGSDGRTVELRKAGRGLLDELDAEVGRQVSLDVAVSETPKSPDYNCDTPATHGTGDHPDSEAADGDAPLTRWQPHHSLGRLPRYRSIAATETAPDGGIAVTNHPIERSPDLAAASLNVSPGQGVTVSAEAHTVLQWWVCSARALTAPRVWNLLDDNDLREKLSDFVIEHKEFLRGASCLGYLPDSVESADEFIDRLEDARDDLLAGTQRLGSDDTEVENPDEFRGMLCRDALGLVGTVTHLFDLLDLSVTFEMRLPRFGRDYSPEKQAMLAQTIAVGTAVCSEYHQTSAYRQLFEVRDGHRASAITPTVDAANPTGRALASWSIVGDFGEQADAFASRLRTALATPADLHDDAPEFGVDVPVQVTENAGRDAMTRVVRGISAHKGLTATHEATSLCHGLCRTPYGAAEALNYLAADENNGRELRAAEMRYALAHVDADRLLRDVAPSVRKLLAALLRADHPYTKTELADAAGVSTQTVRNHLPTLLNVGLVGSGDVDGTYRLRLPYNDETEQYDEVYPEYVRDDPGTHKAAYALRKAADNVTDPGEWEWVTVDLRPDAIRDAEAWTTDILPALWGMSDYDHFDAVETEPEPETVRFGATPAQQPIGGAGDAGADADTEVKA